MRIIRKLLVTHGGRACTEKIWQEECIICILLAKYVKHEHVTCLLFVTGDSKICIFTSIWPLYLIVNQFIYDFITWLSLCSWSLHSETSICPRIINELASICQLLFWYHVSSNLSHWAQQFKKKLRARKLRASAVENFSRLPRYFP